MILKNEVEILKMQLKESNEVGKDLNRQLETANEKILTISSENIDLKIQVDKLIDEIEKLKIQSQELKNENMVKSISKPQLKKLIEAAPMTDYNSNIHFSCSSENKEPSEKSKEESHNFEESHDEEPKERENLILKPIQITSKEDLSEKNQVMNRSSSSEDIDNQVPQGQKEDCEDEELELFLKMESEVLTEVMKSKGMNQNEDPQLASKCTELKIDQNIQNLVMNQIINNNNINQEFSVNKETEEIFEISRQNQKENQYKSSDIKPRQNFNDKEEYSPDDMSPDRDNILAVNNRVSLVHSYSESYLNKEDKLDTDGKSERTSNLEVPGSYMQKINKKYKVLNSQNRFIIDESQNANLNKTEKARKHNLEATANKPVRSNYENAYKSHIPSKNGIQRTSGKFNYAINQGNQNKSNVYERKSSPLQKFEPNKGSKEDFESPRYSNEIDVESNSFDDKWLTEKEYHPQYTPSDSDSQKRIRK